MRDNRQHVEPTANLILNIIRDNDRITIYGLKNKLDDEGNPMKLTVPTIRRYIYALCKTGHLQKSGVHTHTYTVIKDEPFTYIPVGWNKTKRKI